MANKTSTKGKAGRPVTKDKDKSKEVIKEKPIEKVIEVKTPTITEIEKETEKIIEKQIETPVEKSIEKPKVIKKQRDLNEMIDVKCIVQGGLNFITSTGLEVVWDKYGDIYPLEYKELLYMMNKYKRFFEEPWVIMEQDVIEDLHATHFYKNLIDYNEIDSIFTKTPEQVKDILSKVPEGTKRLIADRASSALRNGKLDSLKVVEVLQKELNIELI
ncbi:hypothetical protein [Methanoculleus sp.]|uniref:hypothetical protein n=1 Tax=Methanoculleus sp. TaxID=90427 RepID=UPI0025E69CA4|nr:hypothetical protein [Methanoculleus sp.]MCK9320318.1 hypothetical protein [Methanoculleus sp.]